MTNLRRRRPLDIWPAFVDATASLLIVVVFSLLLAVVGHLVLSTALGERDDSLAKLNSKINKLTEVLSLEKEEASRLQQLLTIRTANLGESKKKIESQQTVLSDREKEVASQLQLIESLRTDIAALVALRDRIQQELEKKISDNQAIKQKLAEENELNVRNVAQVELLNRQLEELRQQLSVISSTLEIAEKEVEIKQAKIDELGSQLNTAFVEKAKLLQKYRSDFFGRLKEALSEHPNIRIEGDRFVLPSELLFESGSDAIGVDGKKQIKQLAQSLKEITALIPADIDWVLRIDGHTDKRPLIDNTKFASNWELSAARAISIVKQLIDYGINAERLAATGFAEFHPTNNDDTHTAYAENRRIELKLTSR